MTGAAILHAIKSIAIPDGPALWLYGESAVAKGDVYNPWHQQSGQGYAKQCRVMSDVKTIDQSYASVILNCPKQQDESVGLLALAMERSNGFVMAVAAKNSGGGRLQDMMAEYGVAFDTLTKDHCRVVWTFNAAKSNREIISKNKKNLEPRMATMDGEDWWTMPGLFGWNKIDLGSQILMQHIPADIGGAVADFGCGYGYVATNLARHYPQITKLDALDIDARAVAATTLNAGPKAQAEWMDIRKLSANRTYDAIVMNPPFHSGKREDIDLGEDFIRAAWQHLNPNGRIFFVANRHLPYEKIVPGLSKIFEDKGYKIITGQKP